MKNKGLFEEFTQFFEKPTREGLRQLIKKNVGELSYCDFKQQWPTYPKLARHLLGLANSGNSCMVIGIFENEDGTLDPKGLEILIDKTEIFNGVKKYLPNVLLTNINILDFAYKASEYPTLIGKRFQVVLMEDDPNHLPFIATDNGDGIRNGAIYLRRGAATEEATYEELQSIINRRIATGYSSQREIDLHKHLEQLKILYGHIDKFHVITSGGLAETLSKMATTIQAASLFGTIKEKIPNPQYPKEDLETFIVNMIEKKKKRIEKELNI